MRLLGRLKKSIRLRRALVFIFDLATVGVAFTLSFLLRFDFNIPPDQLANLEHGLPWIYFIQSSTFISLGLYRGLWSFASIRDLFVIIRGVVFGSAFSVAVLFVSQSRLHGWPRSVFILDAALLILILGGGRFAYRFLREVVWSYRRRRKRILVVGAGQSANLIAREFSSRPELSAQIIGFLDDNFKLKGFRIQGAPVLDKLSALPELLDKHSPQEVIVAIPGLPGNKLKLILEATRARDIPCRMCPPIRDVLLGKVELSQLREVRVEDLLRREVVNVDDPGLSDYFAGKRVLVTGAGGSIGSELCRQILKYNPKTFVLYERSEYNLYRFEMELRQDQSRMANSSALSFVIGDVLDETRLAETFKTYQPEIVIHAAAFKHVPLMEENIYEALRNNVVGTYQLAKTAATHGAERFILVSTDKAVRPTSVMGASKRMAELVANAVASKYNISTSAVRFGNVLDSEGSVLPLFREQISQGGPVTVTHPEVTRYFMTIPEASLLVLQAALLSKGGEVFLLDMGEPVLIRELAEEVIKLSGLKPYVDIDIVFTGLRKGEKLYEDLLIDLNHAQRTSHPKIMVSSGEYSSVLPSDWEKTIQEFFRIDHIPGDTALKQWIVEWVPLYDARTEARELPIPAPNKPLRPAAEEPSYLH